MSQHKNFKLDRLLVELKVSLNDRRFIKHVLAPLYRIARSKKFTLTPFSRVDVEFAAQVLSLYVGRKQQVVIFPSKDPPLRALSSPGAVNLIKGYFPYHPLLEEGLDEGFNEFVVSADFEDMNNWRDKPFSVAIDDRITRVVNGDLELAFLQAARATFPRDIYNVYAEHYDGGGLFLPVIYFIKSIYFEQPRLMKRLALLITLFPRMIPLGRIRSRPSIWLLLAG